MADQNCRDTGESQIDPDDDGTCTECGYPVELVQPDTWVCPHCEQSERLDRAEQERDTAQAKLAALRTAVVEADHELQQILGKALGYPWYKDDPKNFPGATEADGVCTLDAASLAVEAAERLAKAEAERDQAKVDAARWREHYVSWHEAALLAEDAQAKAEAERDALKVIVKDMAWMARRYASGRRSYVAGLFNHHVKRLVELGVELNPTADETIWAQDGGGRIYDGLPDEQAALVQQADRARHDLYWEIDVLRGEAAALRAERDAAAERARQVEAEAAALRVALQRVVDYHVSQWVEYDAKYHASQNDDTGEWGNIVANASQALQSTAGRDLLARLERLERALEGKLDEGTEGTG